MGIETEIAKGFISRMIEHHFPNPGWADDIFNKRPRSDRIVFKRMVPKSTIIERIIDMRTFLTILTGKEPTKVIMGHKQQRELDLELRDLHMIMMPQRGWKGMLVGMNVYFDGCDSRLEVTC